MACISSAVLSILAATSMPVGNAGAQPASAIAAKQSALSAGTEPAASGSSTTGDPAQSNFQQAFSSALLESTAPTCSSGKQLSPGGTPQRATDAQLFKQTDTEPKTGDATSAQTPINGNQILATVNPLISDLFSSVSALTTSGGSKTSDAAVPLASKEQVASKSKTALQSEPVDPKASQSSVDSQNAALIGSVAGSLTGTILAPQATPGIPVLSKAADSAEQVPAPPTSMARELPVGLTTKVQSSIAEASAPAVPDANAPAAPATSAAQPSAHNAQPVAESLSFALLLHPKLVQGPITSSQSVPAIKQASDSPTPAKMPAVADQAGDTADSHSKIAEIAGTVGNPPAQVPQPVRSELKVVDSSQTYGSTPSVAESGAQQSSSSVASQTRTSQDPPSLDPPARVKTEPISDSNSTALSGFSDIAKPVIAATTMSPNAPAVQAKTAQTVSGTSITAQVLNAQNQAPPPAAKEVIVRLQGQTGEAISVRLVDQGGQVQVAVRSSDPATANLLRQDLSSLTNNLDRAGWRPEVLPSAPVTAPFVRETSQGTAHDGQNPQGQGQGTLDWNQQDGSRRRNTVADLWDEILTRHGT